MKFNFAHLFGGTEAGTHSKKPAAGKHKAEDDKDDDDTGAEGDDDKDAEGDDDEDDAEGDDKDKDAVGDDDKDDAEGDDDKDKDKDAKAKKPKSVKQRIAAARKAGARAEKARIAGILGDKAAAGRGEVALSLAMNTDMTVEQAVASLAAMPKGRGRLADAMPPRDPKIGGDAPSGAKGASARLTAAADKKAAAYKERRAR